MARKIQSLREWRQERGLTLHEVGQQLDMLAQSYRRYELAEIAPNIFLAQRIAAVLGVRTDQVLEWQPENEPPSTRRRQVQQPSGDDQDEQGRA